jgi:hypothetical protein
MRIRGHEKKDQRGRKRDVIVDLWVAFAWILNVHEYLCPFQERSSSKRVLEVSKIVLNKVNAMLVWSSIPFPILGCLVTSIVMEKK